jgi:hypothetical protein
MNHFLLGTIHVPSDLLADPLIIQSQTTESSLEIEVHTLCD